MIRRALSFLQNTSGTTAVEFGMLAFPFLGIIFGSIEFGRAMWTREALQATAIAGARCMGLALNGCGTSGVYSSSKTTTYVQNVASSWTVTLGTSGVTLNNSATCGGVSGFSQVSLSYSFRTVVGALIPPLADGVPLSAVACFPNRA